MAESWTLWMLTQTGRYPVVQERQLDTAMYTLDLAVKRRQASGWTVTARNAQRAVLRNGDRAVAFEIVREEKNV